MQREYKREMEAIKMESNWKLSDQQCAYEGRLKEMNREHGTKNAKLNAQLDVCNDQIASLRAQLLKTKI